VARRTLPLPEPVAQYSDNPEFKRWLADATFGITYEQSAWRAVFKSLAEVSSRQYRPQSRLEIRWCVRIVARQFPLSRRLN
jgi:hypothetical protein